MPGRTSARNVAGVVTGASAVTLFEADVRLASRLAFRIKPATKALTALSIEVLAHFDDGSTDWATLANTTAEFTSPSGDILAATIDLTTLAAGTNGHCKVDVSGWAKVRVRVTAATAGTCAYAYAVE